MEVSEPSQAHYPLDFSINMNIKLNCVNRHPEPTNNTSSSAFKVVTPKGKADGE